MQRPTILACSLLVWAAGLLAAPAAQAGVGNLDEGAFIDKLRQEGLGDLLKHHLDTTELVDPVVKKKAKINQLLLDYQNTVDADRTKAEGFLRQALENYQKLIEAHHDDVKRPMWQTDLAQETYEKLLVNLRDNAPSFYEFGVPKTRQKKTFENHIPQVLGHLHEAHRRLFRLDGELAKREDYEEKYVNTGLADRLFEAYFKGKAKFFLAVAAQGVTQLPDRHPYFQNLGDHDRIPNQKEAPEAERKRLWEQTVRMAEPIAEADRFGPVTRGRAWASSAARASASASTRKPWRRWTRPRACWRTMRAPSPTSKSGSRGPRCSTTAATGVRRWAWSPISPPIRW
jgi:hypothetical protein